MKPNGDIVLASTSQTRRRLLEGAGVDFQPVAPNVDELALKNEYRDNGGEASEFAPRLAQAKALEVAARHPNALSIGADQVLWMDGEFFDKPSSSVSARDQLLRLRDRTHILHTAVACAHGSKVIWSHVESPQLTMRPFSLQHLEHYLSTQGSAVMDSVGGYKIEGCGIQLFERISGDYFAILGLPLLPLLAFLRFHGLIET